MFSYLRPLLLLTVPGLLAVFAPTVAAASEGDQVEARAVSAQSDPRELFRRGVEAFNAGELEQSRQLLEQALEMGVETNTLRYNLGVVYFRLSQYERAREQFSKLLTTQHRPLALYNLGLVAEAAGRDEEARQRFRQVMEATEEEGLRRLAASRLEPDPKEDFLPRFEGVASVSYGYEDNLAQLPDSAPASVSDNFSDLMVAVRAHPLQGGSEESAHAAEVTATAYRRHYHSERDFSSDFAQLGLAWVNERGAHRHSVGLRQAYLRFGGRSREWQSSLDLGYRLDDCLSSLPDRCELGFQATQVSAFSDFESRHGQRYRFDASYRQRQGDWDRRLRYRAEYNDREDFERDTLFFSFSPRRHRVDARLRYLGLGDVTLGGELAYRYSDYPDEMRLGPGATGRRIDHRYRGVLTSELAIGDVMVLALEGRFTRNESSLERFDYSNHVIELSLRHRF